VTAFPPFFLVYLFVHEDKWTRVSLLSGILFILFSFISFYFLLLFNRHSTFVLIRLLNASILLNEKNEFYLTDVSDVSPSSEWSSLLASSISYLIKPSNWSTIRHP
jgi:hypothetical protein